MKFTELGISGFHLIESTIHKDHRGEFQEWFKFEAILNEVGMDFHVAQGNISKSAAGVIRGIHYSLSGSGQAKWVTCTSGKILDVAVDLRLGSPTFGKYESVILEEGSGRSVLLDGGLGHAFYSFENNSTVSYLLNDVYSPSMEHSINPFDVFLSIAWPAGGKILSDKDRDAKDVEQMQALHLLPSFKI